MEIGAPLMVEIVRHLSGDAVTDAERAAILDAMRAAIVAHGKRSATVGHLSFTADGGPRVTLHVSLSDEPGSDAATAFAAIDWTGIPLA